jgi:hypothetical protein
MMKRLVVGLLLGAVIGAIGAAVLVQGLGVASFEGKGLVAYLAAAVIGLVTGLVAGKPIWSGDGKIEAGIKAFVGMLVALGAMFVLQKWVTVPVDLTALRAGKGALGLLPAASLPVIGAVLAAIFEIDNTGEPAKEKDDAKAGPVSTTKVRVKEEAAAAEALEDSDEEPPAEKKKR